MNLVKQLGEVAFGTRLRLLTERFMQDGAKVYSSQNVDFEPRWFIMYYLLSKKSPLSISEITAEIGYTQPAVTQIANLMEKKGIIKVVKDKGDTRKKLLVLSPKGKELLPKLEPIWKGFELAVKEIFEKIGFDALLVIDKIENELDKKEMYERVIEKVKQKQSEEVEIINYSPEFKDKFRELNYEWLEKYFSVEDEDKKLLLYPEEEILDKGGAILFAKVDGEVAGTVALINHGEKGYELAKMGVKEKYQSRQVGKMLATALITKARKMKADMIFLETNKKLEKAMNLYKKLGFELVEFNDVSKYARSTIKMELKLK